jgi:hypothetical protein
MAITYITQLNIGPMSLPGTLGVAGNAVITGSVKFGSYILPTGSATAGQVIASDGTCQLVWGVGGGSSAQDLWADTTNPYICTCNGCGICVGNVRATNVLPSGTGNLGENASPGEWSIGYIQCVRAAAGVSIYVDTTQTAKFGSDFACFGTVRTKDIRPFTSGGCCVGISSCRFAEGYLNCLYACRIMKIPVGSNCY